MSLEEKFLGTDQDSLDEWERGELRQRQSALIANLACEIPRHALKEGSKLAAIALKPRVVTKYEYVQSRVRDFRVCKPGEGVVEIGDVPDDELTASSFDPYPNAFTRAYCKSAFESGTLKYLHQKMWSFEFIHLIDISELMVGDEGFLRLCDGLEKCPVKSLILSGNGITDAGIIRFAEIWRSLPHLDSLMLCHNKFTDKGIEAMFHPSRYSSTIRSIDLTRNRIGVRSAFFLGLMFTEERISQLENLTLGVRVGSLSHGDNFVQVLVGFLTAPRARPIRKLDISDAGLGDVGMGAIVALVASSTSIQELHISRNYISPQSRKHLYRGLVANRSLSVFRSYYCGFTSFEEDRIRLLGHRNVVGVGLPIANVLSPVKMIPVLKSSSSKQNTGKRPTLTWTECIQLCDYLVRVLSDCVVYLKKVMEGVSSHDHPPPIGTGNKMFASEARGKLTVLQQISMYGRRSLKATPLRDELDTIKHITMRPVAVSYKKAMYLLGEIKRYKKLSQNEDKGQDDNAAYSENHDYADDDSLESGSPLYLKLIYGDVIILEKWLDYLQTIHVTRALVSRERPQSARENIQASGNLVENYNNCCRIVNEKCDAVRNCTSLIHTETIIDILMEMKLDRVVTVSKNEVMDAEGNEEGSLGSVAVSSIGDQSVSSPNKRYSPQMQLNESRGGERLSPALSRATARTAIDPSEGPSAPRALFGYQFLWAHRDDLVDTVSDIENCSLEKASMTMEDYSSALYEKLISTEQLLAQNMKDSLNVMRGNAEFDEASVLGLPFVKNIGLPVYYVHKCLVEVLNRDKSSDIYSRTDNDSLNDNSTCFDDQIKKKRRAHRKAKKKIGRRFDLYNRQPVGQTSVVEEEEFEMDKGPVEDTNNVFKTDDVSSVKHRHHKKSNFDDAPSSVVSSVSNPSLL